MARIARTLATILAAVTLMIFGASAASAATYVPPTAHVTEATATTDSSVRVADDCTAYVTTNQAGDVIFRDYAPNSEGTMVALAFCEGEQGPRYFVTVGDPGTDGTEAYLVLGLV